MARAACVVIARALLIVPRSVNIDDDMTRFTRTHRRTRWFPGASR